MIGGVPCVMPPAQISLPCKGRPGWGWGSRRDPPPSKLPLKRSNPELLLRRINHALPRSLRIEQLVRFFCLIQFPPMREQMIDIDLAVGNEPRARRLTHGGKSPGADQRHLPAQQIGTDIECDAVAFADEARFAPRAHTAHRLRARRWRRRCVQRSVRATTMREIADSLH